MEDAAKNPNAVVGDFSLLQMIKYHADKPDVLPRDKWPAQVGVEPYTRPTRHDWRRRLR